MLESPRGLRLIVFAAIVLCIVASLTGARAGEDRTGLRIATVDVRKLIDENTMVKTFNDGITKQASDFDIKSKAVQRFPYLLDADQKTLIDLLIKEKAAPNGTLSKEDTAKKEELLKKGQTNNEEAAKLFAIPGTNLTPADEAKIKYYTDMGNAAGQRLQQEQARLKKDLEEKEKEINTTVLEAMQKTLADVAKKNGYNLVLSKEIAPYCEFDCTKDVLTALNKKQDKG